MRWIACLVLMASCLTARSQPAAPGPPDPRHWLMLVSTKNLDPAHEEAFNHWYDDVDIPDVLKVPGYTRARRGLRQNIPGFSSPQQEAEDGRYVALYDIETSNMDRTIIDMLMAAKKMDVTGRSIDALKVTERVYFRRLGDVFEVPAPKRSGERTYLYLERVSCCRDGATTVALDDWYDNTRVPDARAGVDGLVRVARFEVYRVVMVEPRQVPRFLTVYELASDSAERVLAAMRRLDEQEKKADRMSELFDGNAGALYQQIKDVPRH